ncbi:Spy/CpxP family protein refolding chaperone [Thermodesulfobacteriota bacterium]
MLKFTKKTGLKGLLVALVPFLLVGCFEHSRMFKKQDRFEKMVNWVFEDLMDEIDATDSQQQQLSVIKDQLLKECNELHGSKAEMHNLFLEGLRKESPDSAEVHSLVDQRLEQFGVFAHSLADSMLEVHKILTPEQREILIKHVEKKHGCLTGK